MPALKKKLHKKELSPAERRRLFLFLEKSRRNREEAKILDPRWPWPVPDAGTNHAKHPPQLRWNWNDPLALELIRERWDDDVYGGR